MATGGVCLRLPMYLTLRGRAKKGVGAGDQALRSVRDHEVALTCDPQAMLADKPWAHP